LSLASRGLFIVGGAGVGGVESWTPSRSQAEHLDPAATPPITAAAAAGDT